MNTLDQQQLAACKRDLCRRAGQLRQEIRSALDRSAEQSHARIAELARDAEDQSFSNLIVDLNYSEIERDAEELRRVDAALSRLSAGNYGNCEDCHRQIAAARLAAEPAASRCIQCQEAYEKTHLTASTPGL
jgi:RNA polymerase-binding transcription factor DksA